MTDQESARERLILAAQELIEELHGGEPSPREAFAYLTPGLVAERAGVSRPLIYHHWRDEDAFRTFLEEVADRIWSDSALVGDITDMSDDFPANRSDLILGLTWFEQSRSLGERRGNWRASQALTLYGLVTGSSSARSVIERGEMYRKIGDRLGIEPVPPLTYEQVALMISSVVEGATLLHNIAPEEFSRAIEWEPELAPEEVDLPWTLMSVAVESLCSRILRPVQPPEA